MSEVTLRLTVEVAPELIEKLNAFVERLEGASRAVEAALRERPQSDVHMPTTLIAPENYDLEKVRDFFASSAREARVEIIEAVSGAGERQDVGEEGVHLAPTSPSSVVSSLNSPVVETPPASFLGGDKKRGGAAPTVWTQERKDELIRLRGLGWKWPEIHDALNAMPGEKIASANSVEVRWYTLRSLGLVTAVNGASGPSEVRMSIAEARKWAADRGLCNGVGAALDMRRVNAKREDLGLPKIVLESGR